LLHTEAGRKLLAKKDKEGPTVRDSSLWWKRLLVFIAWSIAGLTFVLITYGRNLNDAAAEAFAESATQVFLYIMFIGWGISQIIAGRWLTTKRTIIIVTVIYVIGLGLFTIVINDLNAHHERDQQLLNQARSLGRETKDFRQKLGQILGRTPQTFPEFKSQTDDLKILLDSSDGTINKSRIFLNQFQEESSESAELQPIISLDGQILDDDKKIIGYLREETACARNLLDSSKIEQLSFRKRCIAPAQEKISPMILDEEKLLREIQSKGATLPPDIAEALR